MVFNDEKMMKKWWKKNKMMKKWWNLKWWKNDEKIKWFFGFITSFSCFLFSSYRTYVHVWWFWWWILFQSLKFWLFVWLLWVSSMVYLVSVWCLLVVLVPLVYWFRWFVFLFVCLVFVGFVCLIVLMFVCLFVSLCKPAHGDSARGSLIERIYPWI